MSKYDYFDLFKLGEQEFTRNRNGSYDLLINDTIIRFKPETDYSDFDVPFTITMITDNGKIKETLKFKRTDVIVEDL